MKPVVIFDLDGTVYCGNQLVDNILDYIQFLKQKNVEIYFMTNNSSKSRKQIFDKLLNLGIETELGRVYCCSYIAGEFLKKNSCYYPYVIGSNDLKLELYNSEGINVVDDYKNADSVFVGLDIEFNYLKLSEAIYIILENNGKLIGCNEDRVYPGNNNTLLPGCGPILHSIEFSVNKKSDHILGKPNPYFLNYILNDWRLSVNDVMIIGDSYESDILLADSVGASSILLSSENNFEKLTKMTRVVNNYKELM